jgi:hypothetical protein
MCSFKFFPSKIIFLQTNIPGNERYCILCSNLGLKKSFKIFFWKISFSKSTMRTGPSPKRETQSKKGKCMVSGTNLKSCYCRLNSDHFKCKQSDWEEVLQIPGITNVTLKGNDQSKAIRTCKILLQSLGPKFESLLDKDEVQLDYPFPVVDCLHKFVLTGQLHCQEKDLKALLRAANEFDLADIKKFGGERLMSFISSETVNRNLPAFKGTTLPAPHGHG